MPLSSATLGILHTHTPTHTQRENKSEAPNAYMVSHLRSIKIEQTRLPMYFGFSQGIKAKLKGLSKAKHWGGTLVPVPLKSMSILS